MDGHADRSDTFYNGRGVSTHACRSASADLHQQMLRPLEYIRVCTSTYTPTWEALRPLFAQCRGIDEVVARYDYENDHEVIHDGSGMPLDLSISGDVVYYAQRETASFFDREPVTWDMVTKIRFQDGKIAEITMFVDPAPIDAVYGSPSR